MPYGTERQNRRMNRETQIAEQDRNAAYYYLSAPLYFRTLWRYRKCILLLLLLLLLECPHNKYDAMLMYYNTSKD